MRAGREIRWLTPKPLVAALGEFDLDPAGAPDWPLARKTYLIERGEDGLKEPWFGRVWLSPPFGRYAADGFMKRMVEHNHGTALIFARVETEAFFQNVWESATAVLFLRGRVTFLDEGVEATANAGAPSCLVAYGVEDTRALAASGLPGRLVIMNKTLDVS